MTALRPVFVVPAAIRGATATPSGGNTYNEQVMRCWRAAGYLVDEVAAQGRWPWPTEADRARVAAALAGRPVALVDGLVGSCCPAEISAAVAGGTRVILLIHLPLPAETDLTPEQAHRLGDLERAAIAAASDVVATSHWAARDVDARYRPPRPTAAAVPGADRSVPARGSTPPALLVLGSLTPRKNHVRVVEALETVADLPWSCRFVGPLPDEPRVSADLRQRLAASPVRDRIEVTGAVSPETLEAIWERTDLTLLPSWIETFGLVVTEALAHGVPAIVASGSGAVEALSGGDRDPAAQADSEVPAGLSLPGAFADPWDTAAWADLIRAWLTDPALRQQWREAALVRRDTAPRWEETAAALAAVLRGDR